MSIYFLEAEEKERAFYCQELSDIGLPLKFVSAAEEVEEDAVIVSPFLYPRMTVKFFAEHPLLKFIAARRGGSERIDLGECKSRGIAVSYVPRYGENTVAEHAFALILALSRRLMESIAAGRERNFSYESMLGFDLKGKTLGVVGAGRIGLHTMRIARAFGMRALAYDPRPQLTWSEILDFEYVPFEQLLGESHIVSLHLPLTEETHHLIDAKALSRCRPGALIINTSRGGVIDTNALLDALNSGHLAGAGLDVLEEESVLRHETTKIIGAQIVDKLKSITAGGSTDSGNSNSDNPGRLQEIDCLMRHKALLALPNVIVTPHTGFNSVEASARIRRTTVDNIRAYLAGEPINLVTEIVRSKM